MTWGAKTGHKVVYLIVQILHNISPSWLVLAQLRLEVRGVRGSINYLPAVGRHPVWAVEVEEPRALSETDLLPPGLLSSSHQDSEKSVPSLWPSLRSKTQPSYSLLG